jgi:hypothetical protein
VQADEHTAAGRQRGPLGLLSARQMWTLSVGSAKPWAPLVKHPRWMSSARSMPPPPPVSRKSSAACRKGVSSWTWVEWRYPVVTHKRRVSDTAPAPPEPRPGAEEHLSPQRSPQKQRVPVTPPEKRVKVEAPPELTKEELMMVLPPKAAAALLMGKPPRRNGKCVTGCNFYGTAERGWMCSGCFTRAVDEWKAKRAQGGEALEAPLVDAVSAAQPVAATAPS